MQYRIDKKTGNKISILGFGCMRFPSASKAETLVKYAIDKGINYFDTAWIYPGNEETLGNILHKNNLRSKIYIQTKLPLAVFKNKSESIDFDKYFDQSLERLKTDYVDYYLLHMMTDMDQWKRLKEWGIESWITKKKTSGQIKQIGFSFHGSASEYLKIIDDYNWETTLIQHNYFDENFQAGVKGLQAASAKMPVSIMEPLLGGKLATGLPKDAVKIFKNANPELSPAGWALNWLWNQAEVTTVLSGMNSMEQLEENIRIADASQVNSIDDSKKAVYKSVLEAINRACKNRCTGCNYCMPCPVGVNIPGSFSAYNTVYSMGYIEGVKQYATSTGLMSVKSGSPGLCVNCGKCERKCPQGIKIAEELKITYKKMEPWFIRFIGACARAFLGKKRKKK